jgi:predicted dehydrogenase
MPRALRVAVVGAGSIGREFAITHIGAHTGTCVACVVDLDTAAAAKLAADVGSVLAGANISGRGYRATASKQMGEPTPHANALTDEVLSSCDAVYIGTTPSAHRGLVLRALASDKHVLLEKPLAATADDADAIVQAAEAAAARGVQTNMNIGMRYNAALVEMRRLAIVEHSVGLLRSARLGRHFAAWPREWQRVVWCAGRADGGPLREVGTHFLFAIQELWGHGCVRRVKATVRYAAADAAEEAADATLELACGLRLALRMTTDGSVSGADDTYELALEGERGALVLDGFTSLHRLADGKRTELVSNASYGRTECVEALVAGADGAAAAAPAGSSKRRRSAGRTSRCPVVTVREGRNAQRVLDAILASGGEWVEVS